MDINVANRLIEYRKKAGLSQEELADKLGVSRQAVSKWERTEASPDTDNLIALAKLYGVSLDELVGNEVKDQKIEKPIVNEQDYIHIEDEEESITISKNKIDIVSNDEDDTERRKSKRHPLARAIIDSFAFVIVIIYLFFGFLYKEKIGATQVTCWAGLWPLFILIPLPDGMYHAIRDKKMTKVPFALIITSLFCFLGMLYNLWNPMWVLFLLIPVYYIVFGSFEKHSNKYTDSFENDKE